MNVEGRSVIGGVSRMIRARATESFGSVTQSAMEVVNCTWSSPSAWSNCNFSINMTNRPCYLTSHT